MEYFAHNSLEQSNPEIGDSQEPHRYFNRHLSWLELNDRVLQLAEDPSKPLLERLKFCAIFSQNLDEFFMVRIPSLLKHLNDERQHGPFEQFPPPEVLVRVRQKIHVMLERQMRCFQAELTPALADHGIHLLDVDQMDESKREYFAGRFKSRVFPVLIPIAVGPATPFPYISNKSLSLAVLLRDRLDGTTAFARVKVPKEILPRFGRVDDSSTRFLWLESLIAQHLPSLFPGMEILHYAAFRVTRNADLDLPDEVDDVMGAVEQGLRERRFREVVRLEIQGSMDQSLRSHLITALEVKDRDVYEIDGPLDLSDLATIAQLPGFEEVKERHWRPVIPAGLYVGSQIDGKVDVFAAMRRSDILVHHPYDSFSGSVQRFVEQAVEDPNVLAIKHTVYRTSDASPLVPALIRASERGKQAVCVVELQARFDEDANIRWARKLEESGVHVTYGIPGLKAHAKAILVVRRDEDMIRHYVHIGTGNYHPTTAVLYTDFGLFTTDPEIGAEVAQMFNLLTGYSRPDDVRKVLLAPINLRQGILEEIDRTISANSEKEPARIIMKMNSLVDPASIEALYRASQAGVQVDLNVRGICCIRPGVPGLSENVRVVSIVGRFLEHARVFAFHRQSQWEVYIGSADLMPRNLDARVELVTPLGDLALKEQVLDALERTFADNSNSWELNSDATWTRRHGLPRRDVHQELMAQHAEHGKGTLEI